MVRSLNELVYDLLETYRATLKVTDSVDELQVATWIQHTRAELIKQRLEDPMRTIDEHWVQDLGAIEMQIVDSSVYPTIPSGKTILQTTRDIPTTIHGKGRLGAFTRIAPADRLGVRFNLVSYDRALYSGNGKFNVNDIYTFLDGQKMCLISKSQLHKQLQYIHVKGVFQNPIEAYEFRYGVGSYNWDLEYPISEALVGTMKDMIRKSNFALIHTPLEDNKADGTDTLVNLGGKR